MKPIIGVTSGWDGGSLVEGWPVIYAVKGVIERLEQAGAAPIVLPVVENAGLHEEYLRVIDGLVVSGEILSTHRNVFHETAGDVLTNSNPLRYDNEAAAIRFALNRSVPILGICRGHQVLNTVAGGIMKESDITLDNPVIHQQSGIRPPEQGIHSLKIQPGSKLSSMLQAEQIIVNSFHRQAIDKVPDGFIVSAISPDGSIEAIEMEDEFKFVMGLQFHPEMLQGDCWERFFKQFVDTVKENKI